MWETLMGDKHVPGTGPQFIGIISIHLPKTPRKEVVLHRSSLLMRNFNELVRGHSISEGEGWILNPGLLYHRIHNFIGHLFLVDL